ncbi:MAG: DUF2029 domain-containing protein, partial [Burkholderiales bacterium]|nr:DUF2029 domain-containing protein [Burkholderiales bacterium]
MHWAAPGSAPAARRAGSAAGGSRIAAIASLAILALYVLFACFVAINMHGRVDPAGAPLFYDFSTFYQAGAFARSGHPALAYHDSALFAAVGASFPGTTVRLPWYYPPSFQLLLMPLAALPYVGAWLVWTFGLYGLYALLVARLVGPGHRWLLLLAPVVAFNILVGQNGMLSTVLMGGGVLLLADRPVAGGVLLGLLSYKPHFALLVPLALMAGREWRALVFAAASASASALLALIALGVDPWLDFLQRTVRPLAILDSSSSSLHKFPSTMLMVKSFGASNEIGWACQGVVAAVAAGAAIWVW